MSHGKNPSREDLSAEFQSTQLELAVAWENLVEATDRLQMATAEVNRIRNVIAAWVHEVKKV